MLDSKRYLSRTRQERLVAAETPAEFVHVISIQRRRGDHWIREQVAEKVAIHKVLHWRKCDDTGRVADEVGLGHALRLLPLHALLLLFGLRALKHRVVKVLGRHAGRPQRW